MRLPIKQIQILEFMKSQDGTAKFSEICDRFHNEYYANASHYLSEILKRMVQNGLLVRPKRGWYEIKREIRVFETNDPDQLKLF